MSRRRSSTSAFSLFAFQDIITSVTGIMILVTLVLALELIQRKMQTPAQQTVAVSSQLEEAVSVNRNAIEQMESELNRAAADAADLVRFNPEDLRRTISDFEERNEELQEDLAKLKQQEVQTVQQEKDVESHMKHAPDDRTLNEMDKKIQERREKLKNIKSSNRVVYNPVAGTSKTPWLIEITGGGISAAPIGQSQRPSRFSNQGEFLAWLNGRNPEREYFVLLVKPDGVEQFQSALPQIRGRRFETGLDLLSSEQSAIDPETGAAAQ